MNRDKTKPATLTPSDSAMEREPHENATPQHNAAGLRWLLDRYPRWNLTKEDLSVVLGGVSEKRLDQWEERLHHHDGIELPPETLERVSLLLGIHKALAQIAPDGQEEKAYSMFTQPIHLAGLEGRSIRDFLLEDGSAEALYGIRHALGGFVS